MFAFFGAYHGRTMGSASMTAGYRYRKPFGHFGDEAHFVPYPYCYRCPYGMHCENCNYYCVKQLRREFEDDCSGLYDRKTKQAECAAFFIEPLQGSGGYIAPPQGYFKELKKVLDDYGILLVDDEVQMGFYRTGKLWAIEHYDVTPDVITFGKSLTNGLNPLAGMWAKEELINPEVWPAGRTHSTYCNNPIGMRAGYEVMSIFEGCDFEKEVNEKVKGIDEKLLAKYRAIRKSKGNDIKDVVVPLTMDNRCQGCFMDVPSALVNKIKTDGWVTCDECGRIIYQA